MGFEGQSFFCTRAEGRLSRRLNPHPELKELYHFKEALHGFYRIRGARRSKRAFTGLTDRTIGYRPSIDFFEHLAQIACRRRFFCFSPPGFPVSIMWGPEFRFADTAKRAQSELLTAGFLTNDDDELTFLPLDARRGWIRYE